MQTAEYVDDVINLLEEYGWTQGRYGHSGIGYCLLGAMYQVAYKRGDEERVKFFNCLRKTIGTNPTIAGWNDLPERTKEEVIAVLLKVKENCYADG